MKRVFSILAVSWVLFGGWMTAGADPVGPQAPVFSNNPTVAVIDGQPLHLDDLKNATIHQMMVQTFKMQKSLLKQKALEILQANHEELKLDAIRPVSEEEIKEFYRKEPGIRDIGALEEMKGEIRIYLEKLKRQSYLYNIDKKYEIAVRNGWVIDHFKAPNDFRVQAEIGSAMLWFKGKDNQNRQVLLMEYSDFLCPFCRKVQRTLNALRRKYKDEVEFGYRHFPLHEEARDLAEAVECARDHGKFWEYQGRIYDNPQRHKNLEHLIHTARDAGIKDLTAFESCMVNGKYRERVQSDMEHGFRLGVQGTPTFIIGIFNHEKSTVNGEIFSGAVTGDKFSRLIEKYLALTRVQPSKDACADC